MESRTYRATCPLPCYDTCSILATVEGGLLRSVEGDPLHPLTDGRLCAKGYSYVDQVYATERVHHPMIQSPRGSGQWRRATWDEALGLIADKLNDLRRRHGSLLPVCLYGGMGTRGAQIQASAGLFSSMGPVTEAVPTMCWGAGQDAQVYDFGGLQTSDPRDMLNARTLVLWGTNPAWTAVHQMSIITRARRQGTRVIVIDPVLTATASHADLHLAVRHGTDGALALGMARVMLDEGLCDQRFLHRHVHGWEEFAAYLRAEVSVDWAANETGLPPHMIRQVAREYATAQPAMIWVGLGMQRHSNGGQSVRAIDALSALTGQIGRPGTGVQYCQRHTRVFGSHARSFTAAVQNRLVSAGDIVRTVRALGEPPVRMFWIAGANPGAQVPDTKAFAALLREMDLVVVADMFMTRTTELADIVLPTTSPFERWDLNWSSWHHHISINEKAIEPLFEARSDLEIAWALSAQLEDHCPFPKGGDPRRWMEAEWGTAARELTGKPSPWSLALSGPVRARLPQVAWESLQFETPSGMYELASDRAAERGLPRLPVYVAPLQPPAGYPFRLITPRPAESLNSQFQSVIRPTSRPTVEVHPELAARLGLTDGSMARLHNRQGEVHLTVRVTRTVPPDCAVAYVAAYQEHAPRLNDLIEPRLADMGASVSGFPGIAYYDTFIALEPSTEQGGGGF